LRPTASCWW